ncbi:MAG TPA: hypothetical protein VFY93_13695 [Planctomycetota bacterium]|nr:hypothetical protein [Planctomycetota bacterium]
MGRLPLAGALGALLLLLLPAGADDPKAPWVIDFTHGPLETYSVTYKDGSAKTFYYFTFALKNKSDVAAPLHVAIKATVGSDPKKRKVMPALPAPDAEESIRRLSRAADLKNVQEINKLGVLQPGETARGIAVFGTFNREWDTAIVTVAGLEPYARQCRVRKYGDSGFTVFHRAYAEHNKEILAKAGAGAAFTDSYAILGHNVVWSMKFHREGDEFAPQVDRIYLDGEGWSLGDPAPQIVAEPKPPFRN